MSESRAMVDQKVSELCEQLEKLSSIQERAQTVEKILEKLEDICNDLRLTGDKQVESIEAKIDSFGEGQIEKIRGCLDGFIDSTKNVVSNVDENLVKLNRSLEKIEKTPLVEELRGVRENVSMRLDTLEENVKQLAATLSNATSEVGIVKDRLAEALKREEEHAVETRDGMARLDAVVKGRTGMLGENFQHGQAKQSEELRGVHGDVSTRFDTLEENEEQLAASLSNATSEVGIVKDRLAEALKREEERAAETRDGIAGLDATVKRILNFFIVMGVLTVLGMLIYFLNRCGIVNLVLDIMS